MSAKYILEGCWCYTTLPANNSQIRTMVNLIAYRELFSNNETVTLEKITKKKAKLLGISLENVGWYACLTKKFYFLGKTIKTISWDQLDNFANELHKLNRNELSMGLIASTFDLPYRVVKTTIDDATRLNGVCEADLITAMKCSATLAKLKWQMSLEELFTIIVPLVEVFQDGRKASDVFNRCNSKPISKNNRLLPVD